MIKLPKRYQKKLFSVKHIRQLETELFSHKNSFDVMCEAAEAFCDVLVHEHSPDSHQHQTIHIVLGIGNNAGDGLVIATLLKSIGFRVHAYTTSKQAFHGDANHAYQMAMDNDIQIMPFTFFHCRDNDIIIDAIFGIGLDRTVTGQIQSAINYINRCRKQYPNLRVYAVDIPSGLIADTGVIAGTAVKAHKTITLIADKIGLHTADACNCTGKIIVKTLGLPTIPNIDSPVCCYRYESQPISTTTGNGHKGLFGHTLIVGGGLGMFGAVALSAISALKVGSGKASLFSHSDYKNQYHIQNTPLYEVMHCQQLSNLSHYSAIVLGPGLGRGKWGKKIFTQVIKHQMQQPLLIDADGLYHLATEQLPQNHVAIITPHEAEAARLLHCHVQTIRENKINAVKLLAKQYRCIAVLKGAGTLISDGRQVWINTSGNINLATAGSGDVLAGMIGGYLAVGVSALSAALYGVYQHGLAADRYCYRHPGKNLRASDLWAYF